MDMTAPGKNLLNAAGIIGYTFGLIGILRLFILLMAFLFDIFLGGWPNLTSYYIVYFLLSLASAVYCTYISFMCVKNCQNLEKAAYLEKLGLIHIILIQAIVIVSTFVFSSIWPAHPIFFVLAFLSFILSVDIASMNPIAILIPQLVLPILCISGASRNKEAAKDANEAALVKAASTVIETWQCANCNRSNPASVSSCVFCTTPK